MKLLVHRSRDVRYLMIEPLVNREWEIAEFEIYGDGTLPLFRLE